MFLKILRDMSVTVYLVGLQTYRLEDGPERQLTRRATTPARTVKRTQRKNTNTVKH